ncbi:MAG TPA: cytochrome c biogenesis protein CcsA [Oligoflexia bacterium]|nr:cytochrome c biogenesis protein CcsA [Oligoflexia bacterium]HMR24804.1 cytochrome c biogenesis protein CcsA [Oligoflexia bacterium]
MVIIQIIGFYSYAFLSILFGYKVFKFAHEYIFLCAGLFSVLFIFLSLRLRFLIGKLCFGLSFFLSILAMITMLGAKQERLLHEGYIQEIIWLIHMSSNCTGIIFLSVSLLLGMNYIRNQNLIKRHGDLNQLDLITLSLSKIDGMMSKLLFVVFAVINISLMTGIVLAHSLWDDAWLSNPKFIASSIMWMMFAVLVWGRLKKGWRGKVFVQGLFVCEVVLVGLLLLSFVK